MNSYTALKVPRMDTYRGCVCGGEVLQRLNLVRLPLTLQNQLLNLM